MRIIGQNTQENHIMGFQIIKRGEKWIKHYALEFEVENKKEVLQFFVSV